METGKRVRPAMRHGNDVLQGTFGRKGGWVLTRGADRVVRVWDADNGEPLTPEMVHPAPLVNARFLESESAVVVEDENGMIHLWPLARDSRSWEHLNLMSQLLAGVRSHGTGDLLPPTEGELMAAWQLMKASYPGDFSVTVSDKRDWHLRQAAYHEGRQDWRGLRLHLEALAGLGVTSEGLERRLLEAGEPAQGGGGL
jgi:hypothetical protein